MPSESSRGSNFSLAAVEGGFFVLCHRNCNIVFQKNRDFIESAAHIAFYDNLYDQFCRTYFMQLFEDYQKGAMPRAEWCTRTAFGDAGSGSAAGGELAASGVRKHWFS